MKKLVAVIALFLLSLNSLGFAEETTFNNCKLTDAKGKQTDARLTLSDNSKDMEIKVSGREIVSIPYEDLDKFSYEYTKKHRVTEGAIVMIASLGAGGIVMLTKSKSHWLYVDYREENAPKTLVLRLDKSDYQKVIASIKSHTGKDVEMLNDSGKEKNAEHADEAKTAAGGRM